MSREEEDMRTTTTTEQNVKEKKTRKSLERERKRNNNNNSSSTTQESKAKATTTQQHKTQFPYLEINTHNAFLLLLAAACLLLHTSTRWGHRSEAGPFSLSLSLSLSLSHTHTHTHHSSVRLSSPLLSSQVPRTSCNILLPITSRMEERKVLAMGLCQLSLF
jgi:hypothetical protein